MVESVHRQSGGSIENVVAAMGWGLRHEAQEEEHRTSKLLRSSARDCVSMLASLLNALRAARNRSLYTALACVIEGCCQNGLVVSQKAGDDAVGNVVSHPALTIQPCGGPSSPAGPFNRDGE